MTSLILLLCLFQVLFPLACALATGPPLKKKVIVTGAAGRTGKLVFSSLLQNEKFDPVGLVRTEKSAKKLINNDVKCGLENVWVSDVTELDPNEQNGLPKGLTGAEAMIICTSAVPKISKKSVAKAFIKIPLNLIKGKKFINFRELQFRYSAGQYPEKVDYEGQVAQIELAKKLGISHVVLLGSMGGTNSHDFLNTIGKDKDGNGHGDILIFKRKAEKFLVNSGLHYTIIHPGGLKDTPGGQLDLKLGINDKLLKEEKRSISRCDVARLCVASLTAFNGKNASFDCINSDLKDDGSKPKSAEEAIIEFLQKEEVYDYSI